MYVYENYTKIPSLKQRPDYNFMKYNIKEILPLSSIITKASGRLGDYVFYMHNGKICARKHIIPPNPNTKSQQRGRNLFKKVVEEWRMLDEESKLLWNEAGESVKRRGYNLFISMRMKEYLEIAAQEGAVAGGNTVKPRKRVRIIRSRRVYRVGALHTKSTSQKFLFPRIFKAP